MMKHNISKITPPIFIGLLVIAGVGFATVPWLILHTPPEPQMGIVQYIFYFHVACAWVTLLSAVIAGIAGGIFLFTSSEKADQVTVSAAELVIAFGLCVLVMGSLWGRKYWNTWWNWEIRLTTTLLLWFMFVGYSLARAYAGEQGRRLAAVVAVFGTFMAPLVYFSVSLGKTILHPENKVVSTLDPAMRPAFWSSVGLFLVLFSLLFWLRLQMESLQAFYRQLRFKVEDKNFAEGKK